VHCKLRTRIYECERGRKKEMQTIRQKTLTCIIEMWKVALGIPPAVDIKKETVRSRAKRFKTIGTRVGAGP
jgi:hypothetical protein